MSSLDAARKILETYNGPKIRIMEVCGTHTHEIFRLGIRGILSPQIRLISGPGCPVCVTSAGFIDEAVMLALDHGCTICTFGDLVRVPGSTPDRKSADLKSADEGKRPGAASLADARSKGAKVQVVYSPMDAVEYAAAHRDEQVVFLSVGFETTTPSVCLAVLRAKEEKLDNFSVLTANKTMPGAYEAMKDSTDLFLYPGHVHAITGTGMLKELAARGVSGVCAGFTAPELLTALAVGVKQFEKGEPFFVNCYPRVVRDEGQPAAMRTVEEVMEPCDSDWRGIGMIPMSGMKLRDRYAAFDARVKFDLPPVEARNNPLCRCGEVLQGKCLPKDCRVFGTGCTPEHPIGACMVSGEGACSAFYLYGG